MRSGTPVSRNGPGLRTVPQAHAPESAQLFARIGAFLEQQQLDPVPAHYAFAYRLLREPQGPLACAVAALLDRGLRITPADVAALMQAAAPAGDGAARAAPGAEPSQASGLVARTARQVEEFEDIVRKMLAETQGLGRDLATAAAAALNRGKAGAGTLPEAPAAIAAAMLERLYQAEWRLAQAHKEAGELRGALVVAQADARHDPMTGLANRRAFAEAFERAAAGPRVMAICDVDHFKAINDRFGHAVGDRVLTAVATMLAQAFEGHLVARWGGEEFAVLFADTSLQAARAAVEAARESIAGTTWERAQAIPGGIGAITFSAGLVEAAPHEALDASYWRADACLYLAKTQGRNTVACG